MLKILPSFIFLNLLWCNTTLFAQQVPMAAIDTTTLTIAKINVTGNKHTKAYIVYREMPLKVGNTITTTSLQRGLTQSQIQVYNTNLFVEVLIDTNMLSANALQINVHVRERWYIFPTPQFKLIDRSFNEWYRTFNADFRRVVYGLDFKYYNFSGRRDQLNFSLLNGYGRNISFNYSSPFSNPKLTEGFAVGAGFSQNKEIGYKTSADNLILRYKTNNFVRDNFSVNGSYSWQQGFFKRTTVGFALDYVRVDDSVISQKYNPNYFNKIANKVTYPSFAIGVDYINTDKNAYPLKGLAYSYQLSKRGLGLSGGLNNTTLRGSIIKFITHKHTFYSTLRAAALVKLPLKQAYINQQAIGYGRLQLRGLEVYVVDGVAAITTNYTLSKRIASFKIPVPFHIKALPFIPMNIFAKAYTDFGYSYLQDAYKTKLNNTFLHTAGIGIDLLSIYDIVVKVEYSFNQLGQKGLFLHGGGGY